MGYRSGPRKAQHTSKDYLEFLDGKLGFPKGTLYDLCVGAVKSKIATKEGIKVTYRGVDIWQKHLSNRRFVQVCKAIFLIEFEVTKAGKQYDKVVQVHLDL